MPCAASCVRRATDIGPRGPFLSIVKRWNGHSKTHSFFLEKKSSGVGWVHVNTYWWKGVRFGLNDILKINDHRWLGTGHWSTLIMSFHIYYKKLKSPNLGDQEAKKLHKLYIHTYQMLNCGGTQSCKPIEIKTSRSLTGVFGRAQTQTLWMCAYEWNWVVTSQWLLSSLNSFCLFYAILTFLAPSCSYYFRLFHFLSRG